MPIISIPGLIGKYSAVNMGSASFPFIFINLSKSILSHQISLDVFVSLMPELIVFVSLMCMSLWGKISAKHSGGRILSLRLISIDKS